VDINGDENKLLSDLAIAINLMVEYSSKAQIVIYIRNNTKSRELVYF